MTATASELLSAPLKMRLDREEGWQLPIRSDLDMTVRYLDINQVDKWDSHAFYRSKEQMFQRLKLEEGDEMPHIRLLYALATPRYPRAKAGN